MNWINPNEQLPQDNQKCLMYLENETIVCDEAYIPAHATNYKWLGNPNALCAKSICGFVYALAWMPCPNKPTWT